MKTPSPNPTQPVRIETLLETMVEREASDLFLKSGQRPYLRIDGEIVPTEFPELDEQDINALAAEIMTGEQAQAFATNPDMDLSFGYAALGRFRVNVHRQRGAMGLVLRHVRRPEMTFEDLNLPPVVQTLAEQRRGLVLITGTTGSGKSTTLAAMIEHINQTRQCHVVTIEDPIEFVHDDKMAIISQREVGFDTRNFSEALKRVMRQSPDVIMIGEMRDTETIETAIAAAQTGHLVLSTLHTIDAGQTIERLINYFPEYLHAQVRMEMSLCLRGIVCQRLLPRAEGRGRIPAVETLITTPTIRKLLFEGKTLELPQHIAAGEHAGMQTFNQALAKLHKAGRITRETALAYASSPDELRLMMDGITTGAEGAMAFMRGG